ncbi:unnamed protein product [Cuscuta epithymum]|uniref:Uncharacterized protein n=1 Tax=Cuscuta epithymum TaxID=186058 RepID=A0AAV0FJY6_9ASTE|nr:unnamed protein product [Cuscuta epithymum]
MPLQQLLLQLQQVPPPQTSMLLLRTLPLVPPPSCNSTTGGGLSPTVSTTAPDPLLKQSLPISVFTLYRQSLLHALHNHGRDSYFTHAYMHTLSYTNPATFLLYSYYFNFDMGNTNKGELFQLRLISS